MSPVLSFRTAFLAASLSLTASLMSRRSVDATERSFFALASAVYPSPPSLFSSQPDSASHMSGDSGQRRAMLPYLMPMWSATMLIRLPSISWTPVGVKTTSQPTVKASGASFMWASLTVSRHCCQKGSRWPAMPFVAPGALVSVGSRCGSPSTIFSVVVPFQTTPVSAYTAKVEPPFSIWSARAPLAPTLIQLSSTLTTPGLPSLSPLWKKVVMRAVHSGASGGKYSES
mmetsp:Transcript_523/g.2104  ORF Transcript_523/g.2104 Transcript_523/m.2104 type:complete len:229 (-) Transcript_523:282-968(-)